MTSPIYGKIQAMFETTNQDLSYLCFVGLLDGLLGVAGIIDS
jgi:hypothetical protein